MLAPSSSAFGTALFGSRFQRLELGGGCWLLRGKLASELQPSATELAELWAAQPTAREHFEMYGRTVPVPRYVRLYSQDPLTVHVGGSDFEAVQLGSGTPGFLARVLAGAPACGYNSVVANWYPEGSDYIGWHGDKEKQIDSDAAPIVSLSFGASRRFQVRHEATHRMVFDDVLADGDCVVMGGAGFQQKYKHRLPKMVAKKDGEVAPRMNLTLRKYVAAATAAPTLRTPTRPSKPPTTPARPTKPKREACGDASRRTRPRHVE